jgi:hypothetical protein
MMAVKFPYTSVVISFGTVGIGVPSQVIVIFELPANPPEPTMVVDANPVFGTSSNTGVGTAHSKAL